MYERESLYIGGRWVAPAEGAVLDVINPATEQVIGHAPLASAGRRRPRRRRGTRGVRHGTVAPHLPRGARRGAGLHGGLPHRAGAAPRRVEHR